MRLAFWLKSMMPSCGQPNHAIGATSIVRFPTTCQPLAQRGRSAGDPGLCLAIAVFAVNGRPIALVRRGGQPEPPAGASAIPRLRQLRTDGLRRRREAGEVRDAETWVT